jgi:hypothetical protein
MQFYPEVIGSNQGFQNSKLKLAQNAANAATAGVLAQKLPK